jgi:hypothetical protein
MTTEVITTSSGCGGEAEDDYGLVVMSLGARPALARRIRGLGIMDGVDQTGRIVGGQP